MIDLTEMWENNTVLPVVVVDSISGKVIMLSYMNKEAFARTLRTEKAWYSNRDGSRTFLKGGHSGHEHKLISLKADQSCRSLLMMVDQSAHHSGSNSKYVHNIFGTDEDSLKRYKFGKVEIDENFDFSREDYDDYYEDK